MTSGSPEPNWEPVAPFPSGNATRSFVSGSEAAGRTRITYYRAPGIDHLYATIWFGPLTEGPPDTVHGGAIAAVLDEAMGAVCWMNGHQVVAARITINYLNMTPLGFSGRVESWIENVERRKLLIRCRLTDDAGGVFAEGDGLFIQLSPEMMAQIEQQRQRSGYQ
ncbi:MAG TPA: PaaI family thioesterase [Vicinamibacterales bacterium]|nr:PaaI family thioesterase [Vicinamibacterales bacterium]